MTVTVDIPDEFASAIANGANDPARAILEAVALEGYRSDRLSEAGVRRLLGFATRDEVHGFLKKNGAFMHYTIQDLEHDFAEADRYLAQKVARHSTESPVG